MASAAVAETPVEEYANRLRAVCGAFVVTPGVLHGTVRGEVSVRRRDGLEIAAVRSDARLIARDRACIRRDPGEHVFVILQQSGRARMAQDGRDALLHPGSLVLIDSTRPSAFRYAGGGSRQLSVHVPRAEFVHRFGRAVPACLPIDGASALAASMHGILREATAETGAGMRGYLREAFLSLLGARLCAEGDDPCDDHALAARAVRIIDRRFRDATLTASAVADELGIGLRRLQRLLSARGENPSALIKARRLDHARLRLLARDGDTRRALIATIAHESGFNDISFFNRAFRAAYGTTPGALATRQSG